MKTTVAYSLSEGLIERVRKMSEQLGVSASALTEHLLANALAAPVEELRAQLRVVSASDLTKREREVKEGIKRLLRARANYDGLRRTRSSFTLKEIAHAIGGFPSQVLKPLRDLENRGVLVCVTHETIEAQERMEKGLPVLTPDVEHWTTQQLGKDLLAEP